MRLLLFFALAALATATPFYSGCYCEGTYERIPCPNFRTTFSCKRFQCYEDLVPVYPSNDCKDENFAETPIADLVSTYTTALGPKVIAFQGELDAEEQKWLGEVATKKTDYINKQSELIKEHFKALAEKYPTKADIYTAQETLAIQTITLNIETAITNAKAQYALRKAAYVTRLETFHTALIARYQKCLETRKQKLDEYETKIPTNVDSYVEKLKERLAERKTKLVDAFKKSLKAICDETSEDQINGIAAIYAAEIQKEIDAKVADYKQKLTEHLEGLMINYTHAFTCSPCGALCFSRKTFGCTPFKYDCKLSSKVTGVRKYSYNPRLCKYKACVCTMEIPKTPEALKAEIDALITKAVEDAQGEMDAWVIKQAGINTTTLEKFVSHVEEVQANELTKLKEQFGDEIDQYEQAFLDGRIASHPNEKELAKNTFSARIEAIFTRNKARYTAAITRYEQMLQAQRDSIVNSYSTCLDSIPVKRAAYEKKIGERVAAMRTKLVEALEKYREMNYEACKDYLVQYCGVEGMKADVVVANGEAYKAKLERKDNQKLADFDAHWVEQTATLLGCFDCKTKCRVCDFKAFEFKFQPCTYEPTTFNYCYTKRYCAPKVYSCFGGFYNYGCGCV